MSEKPKRKSVSKMTRAERLSLIVFRNVMERKKLKENMENKMELYSLEQAEYLKEHYKKLVVGKTMGADVKVLINDLIIKEHKQDKYELKGVGHLLNDDSVITYAGIKLICAGMDLNYPENILQGLNQ